MKILVTGFTQRMVNSQRLRYDYVTSVYLLVDALREMGHEVEHRSVAFNENLDQYDLAFVGYAPPKSLTSRHVHEACWCLQSCKRALLYADDWSIATAGSNTRSAIRCMPQWSVFMDFNSEEALTTGAQLQFILDGRWPLLAPMFPWGDHSKLLKSNLDELQMFAWDPTPYVETVYTDIVKERRWIYATLQDHEPWLETLRPQWPVERYGSYRAEDKYIAEKLLLERYARSWGVLCPEYKSAGSGWWRVRYEHAATLGCVLKCGMIDALTMKDSPFRDDVHGPYAYHLKEIEAMSDKCLADLAEWQADWFFEHVNSKQRTLEQLTRALEAAVTL